MKKDNSVSNEKLAVRLTGYGLAAGVFAMTGAEASGQLVYSEIQNLTFNTPGILNPIDLNGDGDIDFEVGLAWDSYILNGYTTYSAFIRNPGTINGWIGNGSYAYELSPYYLISSMRPWTDEIFSYYNLGIASSGGFLGDGNAFIGIRFWDYGNSSGHYGWIRVNIDARATEFVVVDWGYEAQDRQPIFCGVLPADKVPPEPALFTPFTSPVYGNFPISVTFSEYVNNFQHTDIDVSGGIVIAESWETPDNIHYTVMVQPETEGEIIVKVPGSVAVDTDMNDNMPGANKLYLYYLIVPMVEMNAIAEEPVNEPFQVHVNFSEPVNDLSTEDFVVTNASVEFGSLVQHSPTSYEITIIPDRTGYIVLDLPENVVFDGDGHGNLSSESLTIEADLDSPRVVLYTNDTEPVHGVFTLHITFGEVVEGLQESDLRITNGFIGAGTLETTDNMIYTLDIIPAASGEILITMPAEAAFDEDGNGNLASAPLTVLAELPTEAGEFMAEDHFLCYPNPSEGSFNLQVQESLVGSELLIFDTAGTRVFGSRIESPLTEIHAGELSPGTYMVKVIFGENTYSRMITIK